MRPVHFDRSTGLSLVLPLCGDWGSTDTDWTRAPDGVTCPACLEALRLAGSGGQAATASPRPSTPA